MNFFSYVGHKPGSQMCIATTVHGIILLLIDISGYCAALLRDAFLNKLIYH